MIVKRLTPENRKNSVVYNYNFFQQIHKLVQFFDKIGFFHKLLKSPEKERFASVMSKNGQFLRKREPNYYEIVTFVDKIWFAAIKKGFMLRIF